LSGTLNLVIGLAMGLNLIALGSSRLPTLIRAMSLQGMVLGIMPLLMEHERLDCASSSSRWPRWRARDS